MSYSNPMQQTITLPSHDFGAGALATAIKRPVGMRFCRIKEIGLVNITETFTAVTTAGFVRVGTASDADKFAEFNCGTLAATDAAGIRDDANAVLDADNVIDMDNDGDLGASITQLEVALVAPTGGTPAGIACPYFSLEWF